MEIINSYLEKFSDLNLGPEALFGILVVVFLLLYGLSLGRTRALISLLGIYIAYVLQAIFPYFSELHDAVRVSPEMYLTRIALFFVFYLTVFAILNRSLVKHRLTMKEFSIFWVSLISLFQLGILVSIILNFIPVDKLTIFPEYLLGYFAEQRALFFWLTAPVLILLMMRREKRSRSSTQD
ncbi:MAG: hypothetical protein HYT67_00650 [Candidatus Yanofskybacteria bacterium]|nr:hypothetical protein [Candidatus Yanofskybacteria bacterium]